MDNEEKKIEIIADKITKMTVDFAYFLNTTYKRNRELGKDLFAGALVCMTKAMTEGKEKDENVINYVCKKAKELNKTKLVKQ